MLRLFAEEPIRPQYSNSPEYDLFLAKLPKEKVNELKMNSLKFFKTALYRFSLKTLLPENETIDIIQSILFLSLVDRDSLNENRKTFDFLIDHTIPYLFEEEN